MIDLNVTMLVQLAILLALLIVLSQVAFRPFLGLQQARKERLDSEEKQARDLKERSQQMMERYREAIAAAQAKGAAMREEMRKESMAQESTILQKAMQEAGQLMEKMKARISQETEAAKSGLRLQAQTLSREIAEKILGRNLS
jgi:F-type H+-transporting ATPase subunit b